MANVFRETICTEIKAPLGDKECRNGTPETHTEKFKKKTDKRLTGLFSRSRSETPSKINLTKKIKKFQMKHERFHPILEQHKAVRSEDGGGIRYIDDETSTVATLKEIQETSTYLYFDHDASQNSFFERQNKLFN